MPPYRVLAHACRIGTQLSPVHFQRPDSWWVRYITPPFPDNMFFFRTLRFFFQEKGQLRVV